MGMRQLSDIIYRRPVILHSSATVREACAKMRECQCGSILVADEAGHLLGIFTGRDAVSKVLADGTDPVKTKLSEVMTKNPVTLASGKSAIDALRLMWDGGFRHLPVVNSGKIVGVVSRGDFKGCEQDRLDEERDLWDHMR
jgi:CBS domain-containing protein